MNLLALEKKFQELEVRDKEVSNFYNPISKGGKKHLYVNDLKGDFHYNNIIYGMDIFIDQEHTAKYFKPKPQPVPQVKLHSPTKARRLQPAVHALKSYPEKDCYLGIYSSTRIKKPELLLGAIKNTAILRPESDSVNISSPWKTSGVEKSEVENSAAVSRLRVSKSNGPYHTYRNSKEHKENSKISQVRKTAPENTFRQFMDDMEENTHEFNHFASVTGLKPIEKSDSHDLDETDIQFINSLEEMEVELNGIQNSPLQEATESSSSLSSISEPIQIPHSIRSCSIYTILEDREKDFSPYMKSYEFSDSESYMLQIRVLKEHLKYSYSYYSIIFSDISVEGYPQQIVSNVKCLNNGHLQVGSSIIINPNTLFHWMDIHDSMHNHTIRIQVIGHAHVPHNIIDRYLHFDKQTLESEIQLRDELGKYEDYLISQRNIHKQRKVVIQQPNTDITQESDTGRGMSPFRYISTKLQQIRSGKEYSDGINQNTKTEKYSRSSDIQTMKKTTPQIISKIIKRDKTWSTASKPITAMGGGFRTGYSVFNTGQPKTVAKYEKINDTLILINQNQDKKQLNPMTAALYRYRTEKSAYRPDTYPANLSQYQLDDLIEDKYRTTSKSKKKRKASDHDDIDVKGYSVRKSR